MASHDAWMRCRDGTGLVSRIWRPAGPGPWPVLLMRQPYGRAIASTVTYAHPDWYARQGFLVVVQDVRGQGGSEGRFGGFAQEAADGADAVRWARQLPGSNGRLGTYGFSYQGLSQLLNDGGGGQEPDPAALPDCTAPAMAGADEREHWAAEGEAHWWGLGLGWGLQLAALQCRRRGDWENWQRLRASLESGRFLQEGPGLLEELDPQGMAAGWLRADPADAAAWRRHAIAPALLRRPMLLVGGWYDPHLRGVLELWRQARAAGGEPRLHIGAWSHLQWQGGVDRLQLAFFRQVLADPCPHSQAEEPVPPIQLPIQLQCQGSGAWHPAGAGDLSQAPAAPIWGLHSEGLAAMEQEEGRLLPDQTGAGTLTLVHDPWRPVPGRGGHLGLDAGPCERQDLDGRGDVACFTTPPLDRHLRLLGRPELEIRVAADQPGFDLCAALARVTADGRAQQLSTGLRRRRGEGCLRPQRLRIAFQPLLIDLAAGDRLRLSLAGAAWPQIAVNPGDGSLPLGGPGPGHRVISLRLQLGDARLRLLALASGDSARLGQTGPT